MRVHHGLLGGMQRLPLAVDQGVAGQVFHGEHRLTVYRMRHTDAAVDGPITELLAVFFGQHHGACTAVAFVTAFLGAGQAQIFAQHLKQGARG